MQITPLVMHKFDYSFLSCDLLPARFVSISAAISELRERENSRKSDFPALFEKLESIAKVQSIKSSNAIEGIVTSDQRIEEIVNQDSAPLNHDEAEIAGYRDALDLIHRNFAQLDFRERDILALHELMLARLPAAGAGGHYKNADNLIMELRADGTRKIRFTPTPASETAPAMEQLALAYMDARDNPAINKLLLIPSVILDFLCIHPFADGNGRMSRLLSLLLLYKNGYDAVRYISFEEQINNNKPAYYEALKTSSANWRENKNTSLPFIENFISTLLHCHKELDKRFAVVNSGRPTKRRRIEATVMNSLLPISKQEISRILPDVSPTTIELALREMQKSGQIEKLGTTKDAKYLKK